MAGGTPSVMAYRLVRWTAVVILSPLARSRVCCLTRVRSWRGERLSLGQPRLCASFVFPQDTYGEYGTRKKPLILMFSFSTVFVLSNGFTITDVIPVFQVDIKNTIIITLHRTLGEILPTI